MKNITIGFALCGSFCTFDTALIEMEKLARAGYSIIPIMSFNAANINTRFGTAASFKEKMRDISGWDAIEKIEDAEPIGPKKICDIIAVAPCTGNTLAKLANGVTDTPVTMAVKSHLRNKRPVVIAVSTNDALSASARNLGDLLNRKNYYFVPMAQDSPDTKPTSVVADFNLLRKTIEFALDGVQMQPILK